MAQDLFDKIDDYVRLYGYTLHHTTNSPYNRTYINIHSIVLVVDVIKNEFKFIYHIPHTIFTIESGWLSPFYEEQPKYNQFDKMYKKFKDVVERCQDEERSGK